MNFYFVNAYAQSSTSSASNDANDWIQAKLKNLVQVVGGQEWVEKFWGPQNGFEMPDIPKVEEKSTDLKAYDAKKMESKQIKGLTKELKEKLDSSFVQELIETVLNRPAVEEEVGNWLNTLGQGGAREGVYRGIVLGSEYLGKEETPGTLGEETKKFTVYFMSEYLGIQPKANFLDSINVYVTKRLVVEKMIEVIDAFKSDDDLIKWYAIMSEDFAKKYPKLFTGKIRSNQDRNFHYQWAQGVPYEHIQSELIIKLHTIYNSLEK